MCAPPQVILGLASAGLQIAGGFAARRTAYANATQAEQQAATEATLGAVREQRWRSQFRSQISEQTAQLVGRGVALDSPTAVYLARQAGEELAFGAAAARNDSTARQAELTSSAKLMRAQGRQALFGGFSSAATSVLGAAPDLWPELGA